MSTSSEKRVFRVNSSNPVCRLVWPLSCSVRSADLIGTLNRSQNKTMLAPSGQYLKKYQPSRICVTHLSRTVPASMWVPLQPVRSGQSAAFPPELSSSALADVFQWHSSPSQETRRLFRLIWFCQPNLRISLFLRTSVDPALHSIKRGLTSLGRVSQTPLMSSSITPARRRGCVGVSVLAVTSSSRAILPQFSLY